MNRTRTVDASRRSQARGEFPGEPPRAGRAHSSAKSLSSADSREAHRERDELRQAIFEAAQLQRHLCCTRDYRRGPFEIAGEIFPVRHLSGDFCSVRDRDAGVTVALGDIAGKGLSAGLWLTHLLGVVRIFDGDACEPSHTAAAINRHLWEMFAAPPMTSLFLGRLDLATSSLAYCNAGQPPAVMLRRSGEVELLEEGGAILGALPDGIFASARVAFAPGDVLLAASDGITECRNAAGEEFGLEGLLAAARAAASRSARSLLFSILGAAQDFAGARPRDDDFSLLVVCHTDLILRPS